MESRRNLSKNLRTIRELRQESQADFAREIGISKSTLQSIENEKGANLDTLTCIAQSLDIPVAALISSEDQMNDYKTAIKFLRCINFFFKLNPEEKRAFISAVRSLLDVLEKVEWM